MGRRRAHAADQLGLLLLLLKLELKDKLVARSELQAGGVIQQALLPKETPRVAAWDVWISTRPANEEGGDLVDFVTHEDGRVGLVLADVSGKGLPAALLMAQLQAILLAFVLELPSLAALASKLHEAFPRLGLENRFATLVYLELEPGSSRIRLLNAGRRAVARQLPRDRRPPRRGARAPAPRAVEAFPGEARWHDDVSLVVVRRAD